MQAVITVGEFLFLQLHVQMIPTALNGIGVHEILGRSVETKGCCHAVLYAYVDIDGLLELSVLAAPCLGSDICQGANVEIFVAIQAAVFGFGQIGILCGNRQSKDFGCQKPQTDDKDSTISSSLNELHPLF